MLEETPDNSAVYKNGPRTLQQLIDAALSSEDEGDLLKSAIKSCAS
jgi:hypothetical protein